MIVSVEEFNAFSGNRETDRELADLKADILNSAEQIVVDYMGYDPSIQDRVDIISGIGSSRLYPYSMGIIEIDGLSISGEPIAAAELLISNTKNYIVEQNLRPIFRKGIDNIVLRYRSGFASDSREMAIVKSTIKRIASLMLQEANGNIGLTGRSFGDQSRTYVNYSNYDKYLKPLDPLVVVRFS